MQIYSGKKKIPFVKILLALFLILLAAGYYCYRLYFAFTDSDLATQEEQVRDFTKLTETSPFENGGNSEYIEGNLVDTGSNRYFEGVKFYEGEGESKRLLFIEGIVESIDHEAKEVVVGRTDTDMEEVIEYSENDLITFVDYSVSTPVKQIISFSEISVGNIVTYTPPLEGDSNASWIIQR